MNKLRFISVGIPLILTCVLGAMEKGVKDYLKDYPGRFLKGGLYTLFMKSEEECKRFTVSAKNDRGYILQEMVPLDIKTLKEDEERGLSHLYNQASLILSMKLSSETYKICHAGTDSDPDPEITIADILENPTKTIWFVKKSGLVSKE